MLASSRITRHYFHVRNPFDIFFASKPGKRACTRFDGEAREDFLVEPSSSRGMLARLKFDEIAPLIWLQSSQMHHRSGKIRTKIGKQEDCIVRARGLKRFYTRGLFTIDRVAYPLKRGTIKVIRSDRKCTSNRCKSSLSNTLPQNTSGLSWLRSGISSRKLQMK